MPPHTLLVRGGFDYMPTGIYKHISHSGTFKKGHPCYTPKLSEEHKRKISESRLKRKKKYGYLNLFESRKKMSEAKKKNPVKYWLGKKLSIETRIKMSEKAKLRIKEKSPSWKGGITPLVNQIRHCFKYRQWRSDVFTRDDFTCQKCGKRGGDLEAHHLKEFNLILKANNIKTLEEALVREELWNINNGRTLCLKCH